MKRLFLYLAFLVLGYAKSANSQTASQTLSKLYWNADFKQFDQELITYYKKNKNLLFFSFDGILSELKNGGYGNEEGYYKFIFSNNPFFKKDSISGYIFIATIKTDSVESISSVGVFFGDLKEIQADSVANAISNAFSKFSYSKKEMNFGYTKLVRSYFDLDFAGLNGLLSKRQVSYNKDFEIVFELTQK